MSIEWIFYLCDMAQTFKVMSCITLVFSCISIVFRLLYCLEKGGPVTFNKYFKIIPSICFFGIIFMPSESTVNKILIAHYVKQNEFDKLPKKLIDVLEKYLEGEK